MIEVGKKAPAFSLPASSGGKVALKDYAGKRLVLYFYPRNDTPGCTTEAKDFEQQSAAFAELSAVVVGVSKDSIESHLKFCKKYGLGFTLLSDPEGTTIEKYGAWGEKNMYGKKSMGIVRTTVLVDEQGTVRRVFSKVRVNGHVDKVLEALRELDAG
jgi:thioredoxin-dependent peroxiredoxin